MSWNTHIPKFRRFVLQNFPFIEEDFDALTDYELICKVVEYLNKVIDSQNAVVGELESLEALFNELKSYVDNYFDNLDVQEEINNKLDDMVEAGTLQEIVADYLDSKAVFGFDTLADMKNGTNLIAGSYAETLGYYTKNDGGSALYKIREITNDDVVDEKFIVEMNTSDELIAELITESPVNICKVGGNSENFSTVCNYVLGLGKSVYIPKLSFTASSTITITSNDTIFICDGNITFTDTDSTFFSIKSHRNKVEFNGRYTCGSSNVFLEVGGGGNAWNNNVYINDVASSKIGIHINPNNSTGVQYLRCEFNQINASEKGIYFHPGATGASWINANTIIGGELKAPYGIFTEKGANQTDRFNDNYFQRIGFGGTLTCPLTLQFMQNCWFENLRISEGLTGTYDIIMDDCINLDINNEHTLRIPKIQATNSNSTAYNTITARSFIDSDGNYICNKMIYVDDNPFVPSDNMWRFRTADLHRYSNTNTDLVLPAYYFNDILVRVGADNDNLDLTYTLPDIFTRAVKSFYILITFKSSSTSMTFNMYGGTEIVKFDAADAERFSNKLFYCKHIGKGTSNLSDWEVTEVNRVN